MRRLIDKANELSAGLQANVKDYSATLVKRERIDGVLGSHEYMEAKIRHEQTGPDGAVSVPFSVYLHFGLPFHAKFK